MTYTFDQRIPHLPWFCCSFRWKANSVDISISISLIAWINPKRITFQLYFAIFSLVSHKFHMYAMPNPPFCSYYITILLLFCIIALPIPNSKPSYPNTSLPWQLERRVRTPWIVSNGIRVDIPLYISRTCPKQVRNRVLKNLSLCRLRNVCEFYGFQLDVC